jgi:predicted amidohydrolase
MPKKTILQTAPLCAGCVQFNVAMGDVEHNLQTVLAGLERLVQQGVRLAVLPEMWSSGFDYRNLMALAAHTPRVVQALVEFSASRGMVIVGSMPELDGDHLFNTSYLVDSGAVKGRYRKLHLFSPMREDRYLRAGDATLVAETSVGRVGLAICYDLRFPELFRRLTLDGAELICLPAQWPKPRQDHWCTLLKARAIENQVFMVAANCCGVQGKLDFFGMSLIVSPRGEVLAEGGEEPCEVLADLDREDQRVYREAIPAWHDRRPDVYGVLT